MYLDFPELQAAASIQQQQGGYPPCRKLGSVGNCWLIVNLLTVVPASGKPVHTYMEKPFFPLFRSESKETRDRDQNVVQSLLFRTQKIHYATSLFQN